MSEPKKGDRVRVAFDAVYHDGADGRHVVKILGNSPSCTVLMPLPDDATVEILRPPVKVGDVIETAEELDALPVGAVIREIAHRACERWHIGWRRTGAAHEVTPILPATVLDLPDGAA